MRSALASARLRRILIAYTVNRLGTWIGLLALLVAVFDHTHSAFAVSALLLAAQALPVFVVPAVVARVEASRRRRELTGLYFFEALVTVLLAGLIGHFSLPAVLLLAALDGVAALAATALLRAEVARAARELVLGQRAWTANGSASASVEEPPPVGGIQAAPEAERQANAALNVAASVSFVLGPVIGGAVVAAAGARLALLIDAGSFLACGALLVDLHPHVEEAEGDSVRARLRSAWRHIRRVPSLGGLLLAEAVALMFFEAGAPIEVTYAKATLQAGNRGLGLLLTMWGLGGVAGSLAFARLHRRSLAVTLSVGAVLIGLGYLGLAAAPTLALACAAGLLGGVGNGMQWPSMISLVQKLTPPSLHGRLMGALESLGAMSVAIGLVLGGALVAISSTRAAFVAIAVGALATAAVLWRLARERPAHDAQGGGDPSAAAISAAGAVRSVPPRASASE